MPPWSADHKHQTIIRNYGEWSAFSGVLICFWGPAVPAPPARLGGRGRVQGRPVAVLAEHISCLRQPWYFSDEEFVILAETGLADITLNYIKLPLKPCPRGARRRSRSSASHTGTLGPPKRGLSKPTVYRFPQFPLRIKINAFLFGTGLQHIYGKWGKCREHMYMYICSLHSAVCCFVVCYNM